MSKTLPLPSACPRIGILCDQANNTPDAFPNLTPLNPQWVAYRFEHLQRYLGKQPVDIVVCCVSEAQTEAYAGIQTISARPDLMVIVLLSVAAGDSGAFWLEAGAERCLYQPLSEHFLMANIAQSYRHLQRFRHTNTLWQQAKTQVWQLNCQQWELVAPSGTCMTVTQLEMRFLQILMTANGELIPRIQVASKLYINRQAHEFQRMEMLISRLRKKARLQLQQELPIKTSYAGGLAFVAESHIA